MTGVLHFAIYEAEGLNCGAATVQFVTDRGWRLHPPFPSRGGGASAREWLRLDQPLSPSPLSIAQCSTFLEMSQRE